MFSKVKNVTNTGPFDVTESWFNKRTKMKTVVGGGDHYRVFLGKWVENPQQTSFIIKLIKNQRKPHSLH